MKRETPQAYHELKQRHPDWTLLFRNGDDFETFGEDAKAVAKASGVPAEMLEAISVYGFPASALESYLPLLVRAGHRCAIIEQLDNSKNPTSK